MWTGKVYLLAKSIIRTLRKLVVQVQQSYASFSLVWPRPPQNLGTPTSFSIGEVNANGL